MPVKVDYIKLLDFVKPYKVGMSINQIADKTNISRKTITKFLRGKGIEIRNQTVANRLMMSKRTGEENRCNTQKAHEAVKGSKQPIEGLIKRAIGVEKHLSNQSVYEKTIIKELEKRGIGRPSTYASIMKTIEERKYVEKQNKPLNPTRNDPVYKLYFVVPTCRPGLSNGIRHCLNPTKATIPLRKP